MRHTVIPPLHKDAKGIYGDTLFDCNIKLILIGEAHMNYTQKTCTGLEMATFDFAARHR